MTDVQKELGMTIDGNSLSYANIVKAIHVVQKNMDIMGTTQKEAEKTITGSLNAMRSSWGNLLIAMGSGEGLDQCIENMVEAVEIFAGNVMPIAEKALLGIGTLVERLVPVIEKKLPELAEKLLPSLIKAAISLTNGLIKALPSIVKTVAITIVDIFGEQFPIIKKIGDFFKNNANRIADAIKIITVAVLGLVGAFKGFKIAKGITSLFGKSSGDTTSGKPGGILGIFKELAKTKTTTVLKGMANLSIILVGFGALAALLAWVAPKIAGLSDGMSLLEVIGTMAALGVVGALLANFAGVVGKIPITTVVKGLANMAIMLAGMTVVVAVINWFLSYVTFDVKKMLSLALLIGAFGTIGAVLSVFAGIVGMIPIPVVLAGLANIALVLVGITAIIEAFGLLSQIPGFNKFLEEGGQVLVKIFDIIGQMIGSLVGGVLEGISNALPVIGENLAAFAENLRPLFDAFNGVDMTGAGEFFKGLAVFIGAIAVDKIISFFGGKTDFSGISTGLGQLAGDGTKAFFEMVKSIEGSAFDNAGRFFTALDGIGKLPNVGGIGQLFAGENDYSGVAAGLGVLSDDGVKNFFTMVAGFEEIAFTNAEKFFTALDGISKLPNVGGIGQIFTGENDFSGVAAGLEALSGQGVKNFFAMVKDIDESTFAKTTTLFDTLAGIGNVGEQGFWEKVGNALTGGGDTSPLSNIANGLGEFADKATPFFTQVNSLNIGKLNGLWSSLKQSETVTKSVSQIVDEKINDIVGKISNLPVRMGNALRDSGKSLAEAFVTVWTDAVKASVAPVNKLLDGANWILRELGSDKRVIPWQPYARGTSGHKGGNALVNDGRGAELVQMPNGNAFIPKGRNVLLPNAPRGMKVLPAEKTARLMGRKTPTFNYAAGAYKDYTNTGFKNNIYNPFNRILSSFHYMSSGYRSSYASGTGTVKLASYTPENSVSGISARNEEHNTYAPQFTLNISGTGDDRAMARKVKKWVVEAMNDMFDTLETKAPRTQKV